MKPKFTDSARYPNGYRRSVETDVRATFRRIERERKEKADQEALNAAEAQAKVAPMKRTAK